MNMLRTENDHGPDGLWFSLRASLASARDRLAEAATAESVTGSETGVSAPRGAGREGGRDDASPSRILTPEEAVLEAISAHDGGMKQAEIVSALSWSESTVSRKLSALEEREVVTRYQIGREKLVYLAGAEPDSLKSPVARADADQSMRA